MVPGTCASSTPERRQLWYPQRSDPAQHFAWLHGGLLFCALKLSREQKGQEEQVLATQASPPPPSVPTWYLRVWQARPWGHPGHSGSEATPCSASLGRHERKASARGAWKVTANIPFAPKQRIPRWRFQHEHWGLAGPEVSFLPLHTGLQAEAEPNTQSGGNRWCV